MKKLILAGAITALALIGVIAPSPASASSTIMVCVNNEAGLAGRYNLTFYTGNSEKREDTGWKTLNFADSVCYKRKDVRAMNVTIEGYTTKWIKVCDENRRPGESLNVRMKGTLFSQSCQIF